MIARAESVNLDRSRAKRWAALIVILPVIALCGCGGSASSGSAAPPACNALPAASSPDFLVHLTAFMNHLCYQKQNWQHDAEVRTSDGVHPFVKVWYSPSLFDWMTIDNRAGAVPNGAIVVKEQYRTQDAPLTGWSVMVKDSDVSWDGWYWADLASPSPSNPNAPPKPPKEGCAEPQVLFNGAGLYCVNCHASAIKNSGTYSSTAYLNPGSGDLGGLLSPGSGMHHPFQIEDTRDQESQIAPKSSPLLSSLVFANLRPLADVKVPCMVSEAFDHVWSPSAHNGGPQEFLTSDQCASCHDATGTLADLVPNMIYSGADNVPVNLSQYGEWRYSMMALSGRDPIFFAQLDTESTLHGHLEGKPDGAAFVQDFCFRCHGVMGQRQFHIDHVNQPDKLFTRKMLANPRSEYGALARDGVSCTVCHHMSAQDLGEASTYTGLFNLGPANEVYGPFRSNYDPDGGKVDESVIPLPMANALGVLPKIGPQVESAAICASCHVIILPVFDANGRQVIENGEPKTEYEQTTFLEWLNSDFAFVPCQECHMPTKYQGTDLEFKIANIEDSTFPAIPDTGPSTRLPDIDLILQDRTPYSRHQLLGINLFALEMFDQFRPDLGLFKFDPNLPGDLRDQISAQRSAVAGSVQQAQTATATVQVTSIAEAAGNLIVDVMVQNLAGHNFPSGVSFRRAFLNFQVLDVKGNVLWASGNTNAAGVIVDNSGTPLKTEFFSPSQQTFQPHFWQGAPITSDKQVQIYEELLVDPQGMLTTSFLSLDNKVKDNRLQPKGRDPEGPNAEVTAPVGTGADPNYQGECGCSAVRYEIPLGQIAGIPAAIQATLYYQSIPPYYLRQRSEEGHGPDTARLIKFTSLLDTQKYQEISNWKLQIATSGTVVIP
jgi:hypothetical protein